MTTKPLHVSTIPTAAELPCEMTAARRWLLWRYTDGAKVPHSPFPPHRRTDATDPRSWTDFARARAAALKVNALLGFALGDGFVGVDLDGAIDDAGALRPWAAEIVRVANSFTEVSPSGRGLKIYLRLDSGVAVQRNRFPAPGGGIELYVAKRFFATTGARWQDCPLALASAEPVFRLIDEWYGRACASGAQARLEDAPPPLPPPRNGTHGDRAAAHRLAQKMIDGVRLAREGERNNTLYAASFTIAGLCAAGLVDEPSARRALGDAAAACGLSGGEVERTVESGWRSGGARPFSPQAHPAAGRADPAGVAPADEPGWEPPVPLDVVQPPAVHFPVHALTGALRAFVSSLAATHQVDPGLAASLALAAVSGLLAGKTAILHGAGGRQEAGLYVCVFARSGERKSVAANAILAPIVEWEREAALANEAKRRRLRDDIKDVERAIALLREKKAGHEELEAAYARLTALESEARDVRFTATDATPEALQSLMGANGGRGLLMTTEADQLAIIGGRYTNERAVFELFLKAYSADPIVSLRRNRPAERLAAPALAIGIAVQPAVIDDIARIRGASDRGLLPRFLFCQPPSRLGGLSYYGAPPDDGAHRQYRALVRRLADVPVLDNGLRHILRLTQEAEEIVEAWHTALQDEIRADPDGALIPWLARGVGHLIRLAGVLHAAAREDFLDAPIEGDTMEAASALLQYYHAHTGALYPALVGRAEGGMQRAKLILQWIIDARRTEFTQREAHRRLRGSALLRTARDIDCGLGVLEEHGFIRRLPVTTGGRPVVKCLVHPDVGGNP